MLRLRGSALQRVSWGARFWRVPGELLSFLPQSRRGYGEEVNRHDILEVLLQERGVPSIYSIRPNDRGILQEFAVRVRFVRID